MTNYPFKNYPIITLAFTLGLLLTAVPLLLLANPSVQAQSSDLQLTKTDAADPVRAGELLTYTLTVTNTSATTATNVIVTDTLPAEVDFIAAESSQGDCAAPVGRVLTCTLAGDGNVDVLLVSSENGVTGYYTEALTALGYGYTVFDASSDGGPTATLMSAYDLVIWAGGNTGSPSSPGDETELATYLDGGGRLFISAQDYHFFERLTPFMENYLGVSSVSDDNGVTNPITGANDFAGLGPYTTDFGSLSDYSDDITPNSSGRAAFVDDAGHTIGVNTDTTVFFAFPWEAIANQSAADGQEVMQAVIDYLTSSLALGFPPDQTATITVTTRVDAAASGTITNTAGVTSTELAPASAAEPTTIQAAADLRLRKRGPADIIPDEPLTYTLTYSNAGSLTASGVVITDVIPAGLTPLDVSSSGATITPIGSTDFVWQVADLAPGAGGVITVTAHADQGLTPGTAVENAAEIAGETPEGNLGNNRSTVTSAVAGCFARVFDGVSDGPIHATVQAAVDAASPGQLVKVAGTCDDVNQRGGHPQVVHITKSLTIQGGYTLIDWATPDPVAHPTTLDAQGTVQGLGRVIYITGTVDVTLDGLRLVNGQAAGLGGGLLYGSDAGGGIYNPVADLTLRRTQVLSSGVSSAIPDPDEARGGGVYNGSGQLRFIDSQLAYNRLDVSAATYGGGLYNESGAVTSIRTALLSNAALGSGEGAAGYGGGLYNERGALQLTDSSVAQNTANLAGGGLYNAGEGNGTLTLESSIVADNQAFQGGGIYFENHLSVNDSTVDNNQAFSGGGIGLGTTIFGDGDIVEGLHAITVTNSTISRNSAEYAGGGLLMICSGACTTTATIVNSTLSGNGTGNNGDGGAIYQYADSGGRVTTVLTHTTVVSNSAENGGGIYNGDDDSGTVTVRYASTLLAGNSATSTGDDCHNVNGTLTSGDYNLLGSTCPAGGGNDLTFGGSLDSVLDPLALNPPGETETHALVAGSPAADQIPSGANGCDGAITADQRGVARPQSGACDIGAYETRYALGLRKQAAPMTLRPGQPVTFTLTVTGSDVLDSDVVISDTVPDGLTYVPGSISGGDSRDDSAAPQLEWTLDTLPPRTPVSVTFAATVSDTLSHDDVFTNTAAVTSTGTTGTPTEAETAVAVTVPRVQFSQADYTVGEADGTATITVTLDAANPYADVTVPFTTADGSATAGSDYVDGDADLTIPAGQAWTTTTVAITDDDEDEGSETVQLALGTPTGAASASPTAATLTILDDDGFSALYLPLVLRNTAFLPDLVVRDLQVTEDEITVVIANEGTATAQSPFWVDAYLDPDPAPEAVNDTWQLLCEEGIAWGVTDPLAPGEVLTLTSYDQYHVYEESNFSGVVPAGTVLYAQADAANVNDPIGGVLETHEQLGEPYNNLFGPITATTTVTASTSTVTDHSLGVTGALPSRP